MKLTVADLMTRDVVCVDATATLDEALERMDRGHLRHLPVLDQGVFVGTLTDRDLLSATGWLPERIREVYQPDARRPHRVSDVLQQPARHATPDQDAVSALTVEAIATGSGGLAVLERGKVVGILTETDLLRHVAEVGDPRTDVEVRRAMCPSLVTVPVDADLDAAVHAARSHAVRHVPVLDRCGLVGMLSDRDLRRALGVGRPGTYPVVELMVPHPVTVEAGERLPVAVARMLEGGFGALPVTENGDPVGMLGILDVLDLLLDDEA